MAGLIGKLFRIPQRISWCAMLMLAAGLLLAGSAVHVAGPAPGRG